MSLARTPPKEVSGSAPDLTAIRLVSDNTPTINNFTTRHEKRKRGDLLEDDLKSYMADLKKTISTTTETQNHKFTLLFTAIEEIKQQNSEISKSMEFISEKYEHIKAQFDKSEKERSKQLAYIVTLESKIENLERYSRSTSIEIRNVPKKEIETKMDLINMVKNIGSSTKVNIDTNNIKDIFRYNSKSTINMPIVVDFTTTIIKEEVLKAVKKLKRDSKISLTTAHAKIICPTAPIYISESLTAHTKKVYALARKAAQELQYKYCWTNYGCVFLRKQEGTQAVRVCTEEDIIRLK